MFFPHVDLGLPVRGEPPGQPPGEGDPVHCDAAPVGHPPDSPPAQPTTPA